MKENLCTKYTPFTYKYITLNDKPPIMKQNLCIFFFIMGGVEFIWFVLFLLHIKCIICHRNFKLYTQMCTCDMLMYMHSYCIATYHFKLPTMYVLFLSHFSISPEIFMLEDPNCTHLCTCVLCTCA